MNEQENEINMTVWLELTAKARTKMGNQHCTKTDSYWDRPEEVQLGRRGQIQVSLICGDGDWALIRSKDETCKEQLDF